MVQKEKKKKTWKEGDGREKREEEKAEKSNIKYLQCTNVQNTLHFKFTSEFIHP